MAAAAWRRVGFQPRSLDADAHVHTWVWVIPVGKFHDDVSDEDLAAFCRANGNLHHRNMLVHISLLSSSQKNGMGGVSSRFERLRCIRLHTGSSERHRPGHPAVGTLETFHAECSSAKDDREKMKDKGGLGKLLADTYNKRAAAKRMARLSAAAG